MSARVDVRVAEADDVSGILQIERAAVEAPHWAVDVWREMVREGGGNGVRRRRVLVATVLTEDGGGAGGRSGATQAGGIAGVIVGQVLRLPGGEAEAEIESVVAAMAERRRGIGGALCRELLGWFRGQGAGLVELEVRASSAGAIGLYRGLGFAEQGRRPGYYHAPEEDAVRMQLRLGTASEEAAVARYTRATYGS